MENISTDIPLLNVSVPVNIDKWDTEAFAPLVAVVPSNYDEKTTKKIKAYDQNGDIHWLDSKKEPDFQVVVVGINERTEINTEGNIELKKAFKVPSVKKGFTSVNIMSAPPIDEGGGGGGGGGTPPPPICRINGQYEYLHAIKFPGNSLQQYYEDWVLGAPELRVTIFKPTNNFTTLGQFYEGRYEPAKRDDVNDKWHIPFNGQWALFNWFNADYGNIVIYKWVEEDSGNIITIDVKGTIAGVELKGTLNIKNNDDVCQLSLWIKEIVVV